ncbi:MAG: N-acetyltransferase [bacterium]
MTTVRFPDGFHLEQLEKKHRRATLRCGEEAVDRWLKTQARQAQDKRLSVTRVLLDAVDTIAGYYTLALGQVHFDELPHEHARRLPQTLLPIITLAWLGGEQRYQGLGLGTRLLAQALTDCHASGQVVPFVAVILDCLGPAAKSFYQRYDFKELPGHPMRLMLPWSLLDAMMLSNESA